MTKRTSTHRIIAAAVGLTLAAAACGSDARQSAGTPVDSTIDTTTPPAIDAPPATDRPADGGWIDGEPDWRGGDGAGRADEETTMEMAPADLAASGADGEIVAPEPPPGRSVPDATPLRAGSVDDNVDFVGFQDYLRRIADLGVVTRPFDPTGRSIISVVDEGGRPVPGVALEVSTPGGLATLRTTADGTVRFHPASYGLPTDGVAEFGLAGVDVALVPVAAGEDATIVAPGVSLASPVPLDVLFLLDATGSMGDEIDRLKQTIDTVADRVAALDPAPDVRFAMTLYRDEGDAFVTANHDFTGDVDEFQAALADVVADGGGDYPEALDEGLADALAKPSWRDPATTVQLVFVVADAPPQVGRQVATPYTDSIRTAVERGIKILPVASSESDDQAEAVFRQLAQATGAPFVFLSNGAAGASTGENTDITSTDYEELALDELVVRLIAEELSDLNGGGAGGTVTVPTTVAPPTTNPEGQ